MKFALKYLGYIFIGVVLGGLISLLLIGPHTNGEDIFQNLINQRISKPSLGLEIGLSAPNFKLYTYDGELINLYDMLGMPVIINFWATWCAPCIVEMPILQERYDRYDPNLIIFAVNAGEAKSAVQKFVEDNSISFPTLLDPSEIVQKLYSIRAYPTTYFIDQNGVIQAIHIGILSEQKLDYYLGEIGVFDG